MITSTNLHDILKTIYQPERYKDYGPNGLQVEGKEEIKKIAYAVSATRDSIEKAVTLGADALIVHHGIFWKFHGPKTITGAFAKRIKPLIWNQINLFGYHLPMDGHQELGHAAMIAKKLGASSHEPFGGKFEAPIGCKAFFEKPIPTKELKKKLETLLERDVTIAKASEEISSMGIITGGANNEWSVALDEGLDAYLTGEISEYNWHEAKEAGITYFAGGHHATERFGVKAILEHLHQELPESVEHFFIDSENPV